MRLQILDEQGKPIDAMVSVVGNDIVLHSRGGRRGTKAAVNVDYTRGLSLILHRLAELDINVIDAYVDSAPVQNLRLVDRRLLFESELHLPPDDMLSLIRKRMRAVGKSRSDHGGGNSTRRLRICTETALVRQCEAMALRVPRSLG